MRSPDLTQGQIEKAASGWFTGCNSNRNPWILDDAAYPVGVNVVNKGGVVQTRPGYKLALTMPPGNLQGAAIMTINKVDANGNVFQSGDQFLVFAVSGLVYAAPFPLVQPEQITDWTQFQLTNIQFNADAKRVYFCVAQKSLSLVGQNIQLNSTYNVLCMQDGITAAAYWDGDQNLHVNEDAPDSSIPTGTWMAFSGNRLWVARGNALIAGDLLDPLSFLERITGSTQGDFLLPDTITGLVNTVGYTFQTNLIVFTQDQTFSFLSYIANRETWSTTANFQTILYPSLGCVAGLSIVNHAGLLWWYAKGGLVSFNSATTAYLTSRVKYMDNEMSLWTSAMYEDMSGIASCSFGSYLLVSIPSNDVFNSKTTVLDYSVADELNSVSPPAWQGVWTGIRPVNWISTLIESSGAVQCFACSVDYEPLNGSHNHIWMAFQDDRTDSFDYVDSSNALQTAHNPIYCSMESKLLGDGLDLKVFRFLYVNLMELSGAVNFKASYRGTRGAYKELINKAITAITAEWQTDNNAILALLKSGTVLVPQTRRLTSEVAQPVNLEQENSVEYPYDDTVDRCYSIYFQWCGRAAVESLMLVMEPFTEKPSGECNPDETTLNVVTEDGNSQSFNEGQLSATTTTAPASTSPDFSNNLYTRPFTPRTRDVYYSSIPPIKPANLVEGQCITCLPCARDNYPLVTFDPTSNDEGPGYGPVTYFGNAPQAYTASCPLGTVGPTVTTNVLAQTFFALTQQAADQIAYNYALTTAQVQLVCGYGNTPQSYTAYCTPPMVGTPVIATIGANTYFALTQAAANALALSAATSQAQSGLVCNPPAPPAPVITVTISALSGDNSLAAQVLQISVDGGAYQITSIGSTVNAMNQIKYKVSLPAGTPDPSFESNTQLTLTKSGGATINFLATSTTQVLCTYTGTGQPAAQIVGSGLFFNNGYLHPSPYSNTIAGSAYSSASSNLNVLMNQGGYSATYSLFSLETILNFD